MLKMNNFICNPEPQPSLLDLIIRVLSGKKKKRSVLEEVRENTFYIKNRRICNYLRIKRLFGLLGNWVTR